MAHAMHSLLLAAAVVVATTSATLTQIPTNKYCAVAMVNTMSFNVYIRFGSANAYTFHMEGSSGACTASGTYTMAPISSTGNYRVTLAADIMTTDCRTIRANSVTYNPTSQGLAVEGNVNQNSYTAALSVGYCDVAKAVKIVLIVMLTLLGVCVVVCACVVVHCFRMPRRRQQQQQYQQRQMMQQGMIQQAYVVQGGYPESPGPAPAGAYPQPQPGYGQPPMQQGGVAYAAMPPPPPLPYGDPDHPQQGYGQPPPPHQGYAQGYSYGPQPLGSGMEPMQPCPEEPCKPV